ncbi:MAG: S9 family peptidase [Bacteroidales bacterium]|jgi:oligopeptidase B|nr:S9 family peptidase [Bacteroidales bacterium]
MKSNVLFSIIALIMLVTACKTEQTMNAPIAEKKPKELTIHEDIRIDNYYWLRERENPDVISYLDAENAYRKAGMKSTEKLHEKLFEEIVGRIKQTDESVPYKKNGYYFYTRYEEGKEYPIYCRKEGSLEAKEEIMLNVNEMAEGYSYYSVNGLSLSTNNRYLSFGVDSVSRRIYTIQVKDLKTGKILEDMIPMTTGGSTWANDNKTFFYTTKDEQTLRSNEIHQHSLGSSTNDDVLVYTENDETFNTYVYKTKSEKYIVIGSGSTMTTEYQVADANNPKAKFKIIQPRTRGLEYSISHFGDYFYIVTNLEAKNFRLMKTPVTKTNIENWKEVIAHREDVMLEGIELFKEFMVVDERKEGLNQLRIISMKDNSEYYMDFWEEVYTAGVSYNPEFDTKTLRFSYASLTTPSSTFDYDMITKDKTLLKQQEVLGSFSSDDYEAKRIYATAADGKKIPMSIVYKKGIELNGKNPAMIYGYGSYGYTMDPRFSSVRLTLLDRGFVYAIAHVRGGEIYGRGWYEDGKLFNKNNTFTDFNSCSEALIEQGYTNPDKLYAMGGSAGGLLMGAIINLRPDLYNGVIAAVPFVDVVTTMLDETIPLTTGEYDEWGNPNKKKAYEYMLSYSPYDQVEAKDYPNLLVTTGLHDSQVQYWEPAKWVAKLRDMKTDDNKLYMYCNMDTGHGGASGRFERYKETAMEYAFIFMLEGIEE